MAAEISNGSFQTLQYGCDNRDDLVLTENSRTPMKNIKLRGGGIEKAHPSPRDGTDRVKLRSKKRNTKPALEKQRLREELDNKRKKIRQTTITWRRTNGTNGTHQISNGTNGRDMDDMDCPINPLHDSHLNSTSD